MSRPNQMFTYELNPLKGWPSPFALDKVANLSASETDPTLVKAGMVVSLDSNKTFVRGLGVPTRLKAAMPVYLLNSATDYDVVGDDGNIVGAIPWSSNNYTVVQGVVTANTYVRARMSGLVATGGYELETTAYVTTTNFATGDLLSDDATNPGLLNNVAALSEYNGKAGTTICGVVSDGVAANSNGVSVLAFWPVFLPPIAT